jgi:hypothetical protein
VVWLYAGIAWIITGTQGQTITLTDKALKVHPEPLIGIGFVGVLLFVAIFTAVRARGALSAILVFGIIAAAAAVHYLYGWGEVQKRIPDLRVHMNQAFYGAVFVILFPVWMTTTFIFNKLNYYTFEPGRHIGIRHWIGGGDLNFISHDISVKKLPDDIFVHRILGLWWLGFGTGDVVLTYTEPGGAAHKEVIENVWRVDKKLRAVNATLTSTH